MHSRALCFCPFLPSLCPTISFPGVWGMPHIGWQIHRSFDSYMVLVRLLIYLFVYQGFPPSSQCSQCTQGVSLVKATACPQKVEGAARTWVFISLMTLTFCPMEPRIRLSDFLWLVVGYCSLTGSHRHRVNAGGRQCPGDHLGRCALISMHGRFSSLL